LNRRAQLSLIATIAGAFVLSGVALASGNHGKVGQPVIVKGQTKDMISVTVSKVEDPLLSYGADPGTRIIGVVFSVKNIGKVKYDDSPNDLASTVDGQISGGLITGGGACNTPATIKLAPGQSKTFCVPFEIGKSSKLAFIQYDTDSGYGTPAVFAAR
jgi:archaellum component FlaG (FlaF/FlaG flagellin family)